MAEKHLGGNEDGDGEIVLDEAKGEASLTKDSSKRRSSSSPTSAPMSKSPRVDLPSSLSQTPEEISEMDKQKLQAETKADHTRARRKSWRRATLTRRSLPALSNPYQALSRNISISLPQPERLEKLMEASMKMALERAQCLLTSEPNSSLETFQKQAEDIKTEWSSLAKTVRSKEYQLPLLSSRLPEMQKSIERVQEAINGLQNESKSWEALLSQHKSRAEELNRKMGQTSVPLDTSTLAQSSQYDFIQKKPDYNLLLQQQKPKLQTIEMIMDMKSMMIEKLLSIKEHSEFLIKQTSRQLAAEAGFQNLPTDIPKNLLVTPCTSITTLSV